LDFDEEFRRVKRFWAGRAKGGKLQRVSVGFKEPAEILSGFDLSNRPA